MDSQSGYRYGGKVMYDPNLGYDPLEPCNTNQELLSRLAYIGFSKICGSFHHIGIEQSIRVFSSPFIVEKYGHIFKQTPSLLTALCYESNRHGLILYKMPVWKVFLDDMYETLSEDRAFLSDAIRNESNFLNIYSKWKEGVSWMNIYNKFIKIQKCSSYISPPFTNMLGEYFRTNPLCARMSIDTDLFEATSKPEANVRAEMYKAYISAGFLDKKKARKIRSETSEWASCEALKHLLALHNSNPTIYPNIDDLVLQFTDTKYHSVQEAIAQNAPFRILYAFVGFDSVFAKRHLEKRMQNGE